MQVLKALGGLELKIKVLQIFPNVETFLLGYYLTPSNRYSKKPPPTGVLRSRLLAYTHECPLYQAFLEALFHKMHLSPPSAIFRDDPFYNMHLSTPLNSLFWQPSYGSPLSVVFPERPFGGLSWEPSLSSLSQKLPLNSLLRSLQWPLIGAHSQQSFLDAASGSHPKSPLIVKLW